MGRDDGFLSSRHCKSGIGLWVLQYICRGAQRGDQAASAAATNRRHQAGSSRVSTQVAWSRLMYCLEFAVDSELIRRSPCPTGKDGKRRTGLPSLGPSRSRSVLTADELAAIGEVTSTDVAYGPGRPEQLRSHTRDDHRINLQGRSKFHEGRDAVAVDNTMDPLAWLRKHPEYGGTRRTGSHGRGPSEVPRWDAHTGATSGAHRDAGLAPQREGSHGTESRFAHLSRSGRDLGSRCGASTSAPRRPQNT